MPKVFGDASDILDKLSLVGSKAEKGAHIANALWHRPILNGPNLFFLRVDALCGNHVSEKRNAFLKQGAF